MLCYVYAISSPDNLAGTDGIKAIWSAMKILELIVIFYAAAGWMFLCLSVVNWLYYGDNMADIVKEEDNDTKRK